MNYTRLVSDKYTTELNAVNELINAAAATASYAADDESINIIKKYLESFDDPARGRINGMSVTKFYADNIGLVNFFQQLSFGRYVYKYRSRTDSVSWKKQFGPDHYWRLMIKRNKICLNAAFEMLKSAKEKFETFQQVSMNYESKQAEPPKERSWFASKFNMGREKKYESMTSEKGIPPNLYFTMLYFAFSVSYLELKMNNACERMFNGFDNYNGMIIYPLQDEKIIKIYDLHLTMIHDMLEKIKTFKPNEMVDYINAQIQQFIHTLGPMDSSRNESGGATASGRRTRRVHHLKSVRRHKKTHTRTHRK